MSIRQSRRPLALRAASEGREQARCPSMRGNFTQLLPKGTVRTESRITELPTDTPPELADRYAALPLPTARTLPRIERVHSGTTPVGDVPSWTRPSSTSAVTPLFERRNRHG